MARKLMLLLLLLPAFLKAQEVKPVLSQDYLALIQNDSIDVSIQIDTTNSIRNSSLQVLKNYQGTGVRKFKIRNGTLLIKPSVSRVLRFSGSYTTSAEIKTAGRQPKLQDQYVQGRSENGMLTWRGPESGEVFSYGLDIGSLAFDGGNYSYDVHGKLVPLGTGNAQKASPYDNNILRKGKLFSQSLSFQSKYFANSKQVLMAFFKFSKANEQTITRHNKNNTRNFTASLQGNIKDIVITGGFTSSYAIFSNTNRFGLLNRVYQNALLTPISFENAQGSLINTQQRAYAGNTDNPYFLLQHNNPLQQWQTISSMGIEKKWEKFKANITQSVTFLQHGGQEGYKAGTNFFPAGIAAGRKRKDLKYYANANALHHINYGGGYFTSSVAGNYIFTADRSMIDYSPGRSYQYRRMAHNLSVNYSTKFEKNNIEAFAKLENKAYTSNTTASDFFLPSASAFLRHNNLFDGYVMLKLIGTYSRFNSESPIDQSYAGASLLQVSTAQALSFFPQTEVSGFHHLQPVRHKEWTSRLELSYRNKLLFSGEYFQRDIHDDIFPVFQNGELTLKNLASHRHKGIELEASHNLYARVISLSNSLSFLKYSDKVINVGHGYNHTPVAGFSNVHKTIVEGETLGVIEGKAFLRNADGKLTIDDDGFPLAASAKKIIGNPIPDFVLKLSNSINWKNLSLNLNWEWRKGGDVWNGTQAVLDYYGRSKTTGDLRNKTYVFEGATAIGHANKKLVSLYNPALPVDQNAWTRYGFGGVDEAYIQKGGFLRINNIAASYRIKSRRYIQNLLLSFYVNNLVLWTAYSGADPNQLLYDQANANGLDFFNLPSTKNFGISITLQF